MTSLDPSRRTLVTLTLAAGLIASEHEAVGQPIVKPRLRKVALEEHFILPEFVGYLGETKQNVRPELIEKSVSIMSDFGSGRLDVMDLNGVDFVVLSVAGPGVQIEPDTRRANRLAQLCNDTLAKQVQQRPDRYGGFAHLALQDPKAGADELERCIRDLGFKGAMVNGQTNGVYLDDPRYDIFWERAAALQAPIYIHPANPSDYPEMYAGHPEMWGPVWSWAAETCSHAMRLVFSGIFDRYPAARIILGHMGETLPIQLWRLDSRIGISNLRYTIKRKPSDYVRENIYVTTSGVCSDAALRCALDGLGAGNVMFSIDYPYEDSKTAADWISNAKLSDVERQAVAFQNAQVILRL